MVNLNAPLKSLPKISPKYQKLLEKVGLFTVRDLLFYFPARYDDFSKITNLSPDNLGKIVTIEGIVKKTSSRKIPGRKLTITEFILEDQNGSPLKTVWFNQPFMAENLSLGAKIRLSGKLELAGKYFSMTAPAWERATRVATNTGRLVPVYNETAGLTSKFLRWQIQDLIRLSKNIPDPIPTEILKKFNLFSLEKTIRELHFPSSQKALLVAQKRIAFSEMFLIQLKMIVLKNDWEKNFSQTIAFNEDLVKNFTAHLPFKLTNAQRKASFEILKDLEKPRPMNRLLNGDVGAGKTVVAAIATLEAISAGFQVALMAPTEVLARQHFLTFSDLLKDYPVNIALLTNSYKLICHPDKTDSLPRRPASPAGRQAGSISLRSTQNDKREDLLEKIKEGTANLIIGTHALIQKDVKFKNLSLVVIDEQHRFGVAQRSALQSEAMNIEDGNERTIPHLLTMTATPIPRTLSIAFFGSLDISLLDELPKNRKPVITKAISPAGQKEIYNFIRSEIKKGRQVFIIFPLVSESEKMTEVKAATQEHQRLSEKIFPEFQLGLMHGKLKPKEKEEVMRDFKEKKYDILVSTSVVEVGVDVPNATVMIIENAERFGLSQLHQFRGRVGRGEHQSYCFLFSREQKSLFPTRLQTLEKTNSGFEIAEVDLKLRGPGQFFGAAQSGLPDITMENLGNLKLIKFAREEALELFKSDPQLKKHPLLADALKKFDKETHLE